LKTQSTDFEKLLTKATFTMLYATKKYHKTGNSNTAEGIVNE